MTTASETLRNITGLGHEAPAFKDCALVMVDCQNTYREGIMQLTNVEEAIVEAQKLLQKARDLAIPVIHIQHDAGEGTPYDVNAVIGQISSEVAPIEGEPLITKNYPNAFVQTTLDEELKKTGKTNIVLAGFMTHMCINSTAHGGFNLGYAPTIVASATASRPLETANGKILSAEQVHEGALASSRDLYAVVVDTVADLKD